MIERGAVGQAPLSSCPCPCQRRFRRLAFGLVVRCLHGRLLPKLLLDELVGDVYLRARPEGGVACKRRQRRTTRGRLDFYYFVLIVVLIFIVHIAIIDFFVVLNCVDARLLGFII